MVVYRARAMRALGHGIPRLCWQCQSRQYQTHNKLLQQAPPQYNPPPQHAPRAPLTSSRPAPDRQIAPEKIRKGFNPEPIGAPIGFEEAPLDGDDWFAIESGGTTMVERNRARRKVLLKKFDKPYLRDMRNMEAHKGKFYVANSKLYKQEVACYFPNLRGRTLARNTEDTTGILKGKISVVTVFSRMWAQEQKDTFVGQKHNPEIARIIAESGGKAQFVEINHEEFRLASFVLRMFEWNLRRQMSSEAAQRYFLLQGLPQTVKDSIGIMNDRLGYVFLLDEQCKIRWSACGDAWEEEKESFAKGLKKLVDG